MKNADRTRSRRGGDGFSGGRKFNADELQLLLLAQLVDAPRYGYELIKLLDRRSNGFYAPSPGMVYPALTNLEKIGSVTVGAQGIRKRYTLTPAGHAHLAANRERIELLWAKLNYFAHRIGVVRRALGEEKPDEAGSPPLRELMQARQELTRVLSTQGCTATDTQLRIARILERAAAEIAAIGEGDRTD
jgi:DNA-binding PadR family transcriptional regulator